MTDRNDLTGEFEPGTTMCVDYESSSTDLAEVRVVRTTKTQVITTDTFKPEVRWRRKNGRRVGKHGGYSGPLLRVWTAELRTKQRDQRAVRNALAAIRGFESVTRSHRGKLDTKHLESAAYHLAAAVDQDATQRRVNDQTPLHISTRVELGRLQSSIKAKAAELRSDAEMRARDGDHAAASTCSRTARSLEAMLCPPRGDGEGS